MRKAPRIISRKRAPAPAVTNQRYVSDEYSLLDIDDEFGEGVVVRGGVMMRLMPDDDHTHSLPPPEPPMQFPRHITVEAPPLPYDGIEPYIENPLPGIADEVESYPCRQCPDRIFLTSFGLERHTKMTHPDRMGDALLDISKIQEEWKRREKERTRQRERAAMAKMRQEALTNVIARGRDIYVYDNEWEEGGSMMQGTTSSLRSFEPCRICGIYVNTQHPSAMINHMRAHTKNDQLRNHMLAEFGEQFVERVTCRECHLVFSDEPKLFAHIQLMHSRRRKYVCKWCGHVCLSMADLNVHKADVHGMPVTRSREEIRRRAANLLGKKARLQYTPSSVGAMLQHHQTEANFQQHHHPLQRPLEQSANTPLGMKASRQTTLVTTEGLGLQAASRINPADGTPCRTSCDMCGLLMVKPSLLIRHMLRVHNRQSFSATVNVRGMPDIKAQVDKGRVTWFCCDTAFFDRYQFMYHRRSCHQPKYNIANHAPDAVVMQEQPSGEEVAGSSVEHVVDDQVIETHLVEGDTATQAGDIYVLLVADPDADIDSKGEQVWDEASVAEGAIPPGMQQIALTAEQYEQLRMQIDGDLNNMQVVFMDEEEVEDAGTSLSDGAVLPNPDPGQAFIPIDSLVTQVHTEDMPMLHTNEIVIQKH